MARAKNTEQKRSKAPVHALDFQSVPASVMVPRLMVILSALALTVIGLVMVYSSTTVTSLTEGSSSIPDIVKQFFFIVVGVGCAAAICILFQDENRMQSIGRLLWFVCLILFIATILVGSEVYGARRWIILGPVSIQASEFMKIAVLAMAAGIVVDYRQNNIDFNELIKQLAIYAFIPILFLVLPNTLRGQSDMGSTMIIIVGILALIVLCGVPWKFILGVAIVVALLGILLIVLQPYRLDRLSFLNPWQSSDDESYQLVRSLKALAAGGLFGKGIGNSYESFLTFSESDFIFAIVGEEMGFVGAVAVIVLFIVFAVGGFRIALGARSDYHMLLAGSLTTMLVFQAFLNIASVIGAGPTTGKPLPFMSAGGSSMVSSMMIVGILVAISMASDDSGEATKRRENIQVFSSDSLNGSQGIESPRNSLGSHHEQSSSTSRNAAQNSRRSGFSNSNTSRSRSSRQGYTGNSNFRDHDSTRRI